MSKLFPIILLLIVLMPLHASAARIVPTDVGLKDQKNFLTYGGVGGFTGLGGGNGIGGGLPAFGGVGAFGGTTPTPLDGGLGNGLGGVVGGEIGNGIGGGLGGGIGGASGLVPHP